MMIILKIVDITMIQIFLQIQCAVVAEVGLYQIHRIHKHVKILTTELQIGEVIVAPGMIVTLKHVEITMIQISLQIQCAVLAEVVLQPDL